MPLACTLEALLASRPMPKKTDSAPMGVRNIALAIPILREGRFLQHRARSPQDMQTRGGKSGYILITGQGRYQPAPPSAKTGKGRYSAAGRLTGSGNLFFSSYADACASGLGDQAQLKALHEGNAYTSNKMIEVEGISDEDADYIDRELHGAYLYDRQLRKLECWRRLQDVRLIWKSHLKDGDRRPLELRQQERRLEGEIARVYRSINELKEQSRSRSEDPTLTAEVERIKAEIKAVRAGFAPYYKVTNKTPIDEEIATLAKLFRRTSPETRNQPDFEPTFVSRRDALYAQWRATKTDARLKDDQARIKGELDALAVEEAQTEERLSHLKKQREAVNPRAALEDRYQELVKKAYRDDFSHVSSGTRQHIREKYTESGQLFRKLRTGAPPRLHPYDGSGSIYVQFAEGLPVQSLLDGTNTRAQLKASGDNPQHKRLVLMTQHRTLSVPVYLHNDLPRDGNITGIRITRKRDPGKFRTYRSRWDQQRLSAVFNVRAESFAPPVRTPNLTGALAPSFRKLENGDLRIGIFARTDGYLAELRMAHEDRAIWLRPLTEMRLGSEWESIPKQRRARPLNTRPGALKQHRRGVYASLVYADSKNAGKVSEVRNSDHGQGGAGRNAEFELLRTRLLEYVRANQKSIPQWLLNRCRGRRSRSKQDNGFRGLAKFRSKEGMHTLAHLFLVHFDSPTDPFMQTLSDGSRRPLPLHAIQFSERPTLDDIEQMPEDRREIMELLWHWTALDRHNLQHEAGNRGRALRFRKNEYRRLSLFLNQDCTTIKIQDIDQKRALSREGGLENVQRLQGRAVAISELKECLSFAASKLGGKADYVNPPEGHEWAPSVTHYVCGKRVTTIAQDTMVYCEHCKVHYDRDVNAAQNTLAAPDEWLGLKKRPRKRRGSDGGDGGGAGRRDLLGISLNLAGEAGANNTKSRGRKAS